MWNQHKGNGKALTCNAAGSKPTADISEVLPPTQSNIGNRANHPSILAVLSNREFSWVIATPCKTDRAVSQIMNCSCSHRSNMWKGCMIKQKLTAHDSWTRCNTIIKNKQEPEVKTCFENSSPASRKAFCTSSRPLRVSGVPPLCKNKQYHK